MAIVVLEMEKAKAQLVPTLTTAKLEKMMTGTKHDGH